MHLVGNPGGPIRVLAEARGGALAERDGVVTWTVDLDAPPGKFFVRLKAAGSAARPAGGPAALATGAIRMNVP